MNDVDRSPSPLRTILAATDFSPAAEEGGRWAAALAESHGAAFHLLHVVELFEWTGEYADVTEETAKRLREAAEKRLQGLAAGAAAEIRWQVRQGHATREILAVAEELDADLVVVGACGHGRFDHLMMGSTTSQVVRRARCPVLSVRGDRRGGERPPRPRRILAAVDFSAAAENAVRIALDLFSGSGAELELILLHAYHVPYEFTMGTVYGMSEAGLRLRATVGAEVEERLQEMARSLARESLRLRVVARHGEPAEVAVEEAATAGADLIVLGAQGRSALLEALLGGTAERIVQRASCPVLTVRRR